MLFVTNCYLIFEVHLNYFSNSFLEFYSFEVFSNLLRVSICEMLHFVRSYMKQNKSHKQTLESAQNGLEIHLKGKRTLCDSCHKEHASH